MTTSEYVITVDMAGANVTWKGETLTITSEELEAGGWEFEPSCTRDHCDNGDCDPCDEPHFDDKDLEIWQILRQWHDDNHEGAVKFCYAEPCKSLCDEVDL